MIKDYQDLIDRYLRQEMTDEEKKQFEQKLAHDKGLRREYQLTRLIAEEVGELTMREQMSQWDKEVDEEERTAAKKPARRKVMAIALSAAAALLIGGILLQGYFVAEDNTEKVATTTMPSDSLHVEETFQVADADNAKTVRPQKTQSIVPDTVTEVREEIVRAPLMENNYAEDHHAPDHEHLMENNYAESDDISDYKPKRADAEWPGDGIYNLNRYLARLYKDFKDDFMALYQDSAEGNKNWAEFLKEPSNERWEIVRMFLDKRLSAKSGSGEEGLAGRKKADSIPISKTSSNKKQ